jgi:2-acylglycerol O-acyltransferase 2
LALQHGVPILPAFTFGLRNSFDFWIPRSKLAKTIARKIGFLPMLFFGMFGIPFAPSKPCSYTTVVGKPIIVPKIDEPTEEDLLKYHAIFLEEITRIYELYKKENGMGHVTLRIA